jgi:hypothetical protein
MELAAWHMSQSRDRVQAELGACHLGQSPVIVYVTGTAVLPSLRRRCAVARCMQPGTQKRCRCVPCCCAGRAAILRAPCSERPAACPGTWPCSVPVPQACAACATPASQISLPAACMNLMHDAPLHPVPPALSPAPCNHLAKLERWQQARACHYGPSCEEPAAAKNASMRPPVATQGCQTWMCQVATQGLLVAKNEHPRTKMAHQEGTGVTTAGAVRACKSGACVHARARPQARAPARERVRRAL